MSKASKRRFKASAQCYGGKYKESFLFVKSPSSATTEAVFLKCVRVGCSSDGDNKCGKCRTPYCSRECQLLDWAGHKKVCKQRAAGTASTTPAPSSSSASSSSSSSSSCAAVPSVPVVAVSMEDTLLTLNSKSVKELKAVASWSGISLAGCLEKTDMVSALTQQLEKLVLAKPRASVLMDPSIVSELWANAGKEACEYLRTSRVTYFSMAVCATLAPLSLISCSFLLTLFDVDIPIGRSSGNQIQMTSKVLPLLV